MKNRKVYFPKSDEVFIVPSVLSADFSCLRREIEAVEHYSGWIQLDVMDGHFVPNLSFGPHIAASLKKITNLPIDAHLMVENPCDFVDPFVSAGADLITVHAESKDFFKAFKMIKKAKLKAGIAINPSTTVSTFLKYLKNADLVLIMTVNPGFGGQKFIERMLEKIKKIKKFKEEKGLDFHIQVDGGVKEENMFKCIEAGANSLVMGSGVYGKKNPEHIKKLAESIRRFKQNNA